MRVLVVGGGIGGLTAAIALSHAGADVHVIERAPTLEPVGAGITLQPNAASVLHALGVRLPADALRALPQFQVTDHAGRRLLTNDFRAADLDHPGGAIHRADLHRALVDACPAPVELGCALQDLDVTPDGVRVTRSDGRVDTWDRVVGADGVRSQTRASLLGDLGLRYSGQTCWRFVAHAPDHVPPMAEERWFRGRRVGLVPLTRGRVYCFLVATAPQGQTPPPDALDRFVELEPRLAPLLATQPHVHHDDLLDQPDIQFGQGSVVLIGDAAHAVTPNLGQGAGMAIEDAVALGLAARQGAADLAYALDRARRERVRRVLKTSWQMGAVSHWRSPLGTAVRDGMMRMTGRNAGRHALALWTPGFELADAWRAPAGTD